MSKMIKPLCCNILLSQQNEKQVASTTGSVRLCSAFLNLSFLKETFHRNFTLKRNNSLLSIMAYTFSVLCRSSSLPVTTMLLGCAAPAFRWNGHIKRKQTLEAKFHISSHTSQDHYLDILGRDSIAVTQSKAEAGNSKIFTYPFTLPQESPAAGRWSKYQPCG